MDDIMSRRVVYQLPGMDTIQVRSGIAYKTVEDGDLKLDVYLPPDLSAGERRPAVLFVHGEPWTTEAVCFDALAAGQYIWWGRLVAASGWIGVPFEHRNSRACTALPEVASDLDDLIAFIRTQIPEADPDRLSSGSAQVAEPMACAPRFATPTTSAAPSSITPSLSHFTTARSSRRTFPTRHYASIRPLLILVRKESRSRRF